MSPRRSAWKQMCPPTHTPPSPDFWKNGVKVWSCWKQLFNRHCLSEKIHLRTVERTSDCQICIIADGKNHSLVSIFYHLCLSWSLISTGCEPNTAFLSLWHRHRVRHMESGKKSHNCPGPYQCMRCTSAKGCLCRTLYEHTELVLTKYRSAPFA